MDHWVAALKDIWSFSKWWFPSFLIFFGATIDAIESPTSDAWKSVIAVGFILNILAIAQVWV